MVDYFYFLELHVTVGTFHDGFFAKLHVKLQITRADIELAVVALGWQRADHAPCEM
jgi:hypothetical protein